jgi:hypothetical protein
MIVDARTERLQNRMILIGDMYENQLKELLPVSTHNLLDWIDMVENSNLSYSDVIRVRINPDSTFSLLDFRMPTSMGRKQNSIPQNQVPRWIMETVSMLRIAQENQLIPELGFKVSDTLYYILDREGKNDD